MERLILSEEMSGFSIRTETSGVQQKSIRTNGETGEHSGVHGQTNGLSSARIGSLESFASVPARSNFEYGFGTTNGETKAVLNADLGGDKGMVRVHSEITGGGVVAQAPETLLAGPERSGWGGKTDGTRNNRDELGVEDWLEASHALFDTAVADP